MSETPVADLIESYMERKVPIPPGIYPLERKVVWRTGYSFIPERSGDTGIFIGLVGNEREDFFDWSENDEVELTEEQIDEILNAKDAKTRAVAGPVPD